MHLGNHVAVGRNLVEMDILRTCQPLQDLSCGGVAHIAFHITWPALHSTIEMGAMEIHDVVDLWGASGRPRRPDLECGELVHHHSRCGESLILEIFWGSKHNLFYVVRLSCTSVVVTYVVTSFGAFCESQIGPPWKSM